MPTVHINQFGAVAYKVIYRPLRTHLKANVLTSHLSSSCPRIRHLVFHITARLDASSDDIVVAVQGILTHHAPYTGVSRPRSIAGIRLGRICQHVTHILARLHNRIVPSQYRLSVAGLSQLIGVSLRMRPRSSLVEEPCVVEVRTVGSQALQFPQVPTWTLIAFLVGVPSGTHKRTEYLIPLRYLYLTRFIVWRLTMPCSTPISPVARVARVKVHSAVVPSTNLTIDAFHIRPLGIVIVSA